MADSIGEELRNFYSFLKYPRQDFFKESFGLNNFVPILTTYYIIFICGIIVLAPFAALAGLDSMPHKLEELQDMNPWLLIFLAVLTQPFLEEVMFRLPLKYHRGLIVLILSMIAMIIYMALNKIIPYNESDDSVPYSIIIPIVFFIITTTILYLYYSQETRIYHLKNFVTKYFPHLFYTVAVYFAFVHFFNFETTGNQWIYTPIMVFPQFLIALFVGYTRLKYGFLSAVVVHMINNFIPLMLMLFVKPETVIGLLM